MSARRLLALVGLLAALVARPSLASDGAPENILPVSKGVYRLPFPSGTSVRITRDHITHGPAHNRIDMSSLDNSNWQNQVVAAGDGWIEYIQDGFDVTCPSADSNPTPCNGYSGPSSVCCVRGTPGCNTCNGGGPGCTVTCRNNYVFIRHLNGEWTKYTHFQVGSVTAQGWSVGDWVNAGNVLGLEGDVGLAGGVHVHFEAGVPDAVDGSLPPGDPAYDPLGINPGTCGTCGFPGVPDDDAIVVNANRQNRIPVFCQVPFPVVDGATYTAAACDGQCATATTQLFGTITDDNVFYRQVTETATVSQTGFTVRGGAGASVRAGERVTLGPGFTAEPGSYFAASIGACDTPGL